MLVEAYYKHNYVRTYFYLFLCLLKQRLYILILSLYLLVALVSCSEYNRILKSDDIELKYESAVKYFDNKQYVKAYPLVEELIVMMRGSARAEKLMFMQAECDYQTGDLILASYRYKTFYKTYPSSENAENALFLSAYCNYKNSPKPSLDQTNTYRAISEFQSFADKFPNSTLIDSTNTLIDILRGKLDQKSYDISYQYYHMKNYKAAVTAFENHIKDFPDSKYMEISHFHLIKARFLLAKNSIESKKAERVEETIKSYINFVNSFPNSKLIRDAESVYEQALKEKEKLSNQKS